MDVPLITKAEGLYDMLEEGEDSVLFGQPDEDNPGQFKTEAVILDKSTWIEMGQPALITVAVVPGDTLNEPDEQEKGDVDRWRHVPGRCDACGGFTESDDAEFCAMCRSTGLDLEQIRRNKMGGTADEPVITSIHGITVDDLPRSDNGWVTLPDGNKVRAGEAEDALAAWKEANIMGMNADEAITQPVG